MRGSKKCIVLLMAICLSLGVFFQTNASDIIPEEQLMTSSYRKAYVKENQIKIYKFKEENKKLDKALKKLQKTKKVAVTEKGKIGVGSYWVKTNKETDVYYVGKVKDNKPNGQGCLYKKISAIDLGLFDDVEKALSESYYVKMYEGNFKKGKLDGFGRKYILPTEEFEVGGNKTEIVPLILYKEISDDVELNLNETANPLCYEGFFKGNKYSGKQLISEEETVIEIKQLFLEKIDNRIKRIWVEEDSEKIIDIFTHTNIYEKSSISQSIKAINDIGRTDDKKRYIDALNGINNDTLCIIRAYKEWENKKTLRKYGFLIVLLALGVCLIPFGIGIIVVLVGAIWVTMKLIKVHKMKKTWNLLTLNGEVIHPQMLVDDIKEENTVKEIAEVKSGEAEKIEIEKAEIASRTVRGVVYESLEKADLARKEHSEIDQLKKELLKTKSQKKRRKIVGNFSEKLQMQDAIKRYDLLLAKVSEKTPISEKIRIAYGITVLLTFVLAVFLLMLEPAASSFTVICGVWSGFGVWICAIWKIVQVIRSRNKNYYKNIKYI